MSCKCVTGFETCCGKASGDARVVRFSMTYDMVTSSSAEQGDTAEAGFIARDGDVLPIKTIDDGYLPAGTIDEIRERDDLEHEMEVDDFVSMIQELNSGRYPIEPSNSDIQAGTWFSIVNDNEPWSGIPGPLSGSVPEEVISVTYSIHPPTGSDDAYAKWLAGLMGVL